MEIPALRTRTSVTFRAPGPRPGMSSGNVAVISRDSLNWKDAEGVWQPVDNTLISAGGGFENRANAYRVRLPSSLADPLSVTRDGLTLGLALQGAHGDAAVAGRSASYAGAFRGVTVRYFAEADSVKETLTLTDAAAQSSFVYALSLSPGLSAGANRAGGVDVRDVGGALRFGLSPAFARDAAGAVGPVSVTVVGQTVTMAVSKVWLADPKRVFPVVVDPNVETTSLLRDCTIENGGSANTSFCSTSTLDVGKNGTTLDRSLLQFDVSDIPRGVQILNAHLDLYLGSESTTSSASIGLYRVTRSWTSSATWNKYDGTNVWTAAGGDFDATALDSRTIGGTTGTTFSWYPTSLVQDWVDGISTNNGLLVKQATESVSNVLHFNSNEAGSHAPALVVTYQARIGDSSQYTMLRHQLDDRVGFAINVASGDVMTRQSHFKLAGTAGFDFAFDSWHDSRANGWWFASKNWEDMLTVCLNIFGDGSVEARLPDGQDVVFKPNGSGGYISPPGLDATLYHHSAADWTITYTASGDKLNFFSWGGLNTLQDKNNNTITVNWDGQPASVTDTKGNDTTVTYDEHGYISQLTDPGSRTYQFAHNDPVQHQILDSYTNAGGKTTYYEYDGSPNAKIEEIIAPEGNEVEFTYENTWLGRVTSMTLESEPDPGSETGPTWTFSYATSDAACPGGTFSVTTVTDPESNVTKYCSDREARVIKVIDALSKTHSSSWTNGRLTGSTDALSQTTQFHYSSASNLLDWSQGPTQDSTHRPSFAYTQTGDDHYSLTNFTDEQGNSWDYGYDDGANDKGNLSSGGGTGQTPIKFTYNSNGTVATATDGKATETSGCPIVSSHHTTYCYSYTSGNLTGVTGPLGSETLTYDSLNRLATVTDYKSQVSTYSYDDLDRVTQIAYTSGPTFAYTYDDNGNLLTETQGTDTTTYTYDIFNRVTEEERPDTSTVVYGYDDNSNLTSVTDTNGTTTYTYDARNALATLTEPGTTDQITFGYNDDGSRNQIDYPNGVRTTITYDNAQKITEVKAVILASSTILTDFTYSYARSSHDTNLRQNMGARYPGSSTVTTSYYCYDAQLRLKSADTSSSTCPNSSAAYRYTYDDNGNLTAKTISGTTTNYTYNSANELSGTGFAYDGNGNQTNNGSIFSSASYNKADQMTSITPTGGSARASTYQGIGQANRLTAGGIGYLTDRLGLAAETGGPANTIYIREPDGTILGQEQGSNRYHFLFDGLGSVAVATNSSASAVRVIKYDPYGNRTSSTGTLSYEPIQFAGGYYDAENGSGPSLYHFGERYYDADHGRWAQVDAYDNPLDGAGWNRYLYAADDPVNRLDPNGTFSLHSFIEDVGTAADVVGAACAIGAAVSAASVVGSPGAPAFAACSAIATTTGVIIGTSYWAERHFGHRRRHG